MREDEKFVIQALAAYCSGEWRPGEDPPDAYIDVCQAIIAVEISTLSEHVTSDMGTHARLSDDQTAIRLADQLNDDMQALIPDGTTVGLRLSSPIARVKKTKAQLAATIETMMRDGVPDGTEVEKAIYGNNVLLWVSKHNDLQYKKVSAVISNRHSNPNILRNAADTLEDRINTKSRKCRGVKVRPLWLALFNDYWLADAHTYSLAMSGICAVHPFDKILIVAGDGSISVLHDGPRRAG
jgi:hypothetical protein